MPCFSCFVLGLFFLFVCPASVHAKENAAIGYDDHTYAVLPVFVLFFITFILVIVFLSVSLIHCRRKLRQCHENLLRCITENLELKKNIPTWSVLICSTSPTSLPKNLSK